MVQWVIEIPDGVANYLTTSVVGVAILIMLRFLYSRIAPMMTKSGKGKAAAQCCHAVLDTYKQALRMYPSMLEQWEDSGQPKITLKVESEAELMELVGKARKVGLPAQAIRDAGRTQLTPGTKTVAAIGPGHKTEILPLTNSIGPAKMIDLVTGHLRLY